MKWTDQEMIFAEGFHTAFRKGLDSIASVIIWNTIRLLDAEIWHDFCAEVVSGEGSLEERCKKAEAIQRGEAACNLMRTGLDMMESGEFEAIDKHWLGDLRDARTKKTERPEQPEPPKPSAV